MELILASASPRRQELIRLLGQPWRVMVAQVDESSVSHPDPAQDVIETARLKAADVVGRAPAGALVIAADTTVVLDGRVLNKPVDAADARDMLRRLRGRVHHVHTGIVVVDTRTDRWLTDVATIEVPMRRYSDAEIETYVWIETESFRDRNRHIQTEETNSRNRVCRRNRSCRQKRNVFQHRR